MAAAKDVLEHYREKARLMVGRLNDELESARWHKKRALAEEHLLGRLSEADGDVARELDLLSERRTSVEWQAEIDRLQGQKDAIQRLIAETAVEA